MANEPKKKIDNDDDFIEKLDTEYPLSGGETEEEFDDYEDEDDADDEMNEEDEKEEEE